MNETAAQPPAKTYSAAVLVIGNEILSGRTRDANLPYLAVELNKLGIRLAEARVVPDIEARIVAAVNALRVLYDYVFTTGGFGPTHDDITAEAIARAFEVPLLRHPEAAERLARQYRNRDIELNEARLRMAHTPEGASLIINPVSRAPGFRIGNVFVMAGIPRVMQAMFDAVKHDLRGGRPMLSRSVSCHLPEGVIAKGLGDIQTRFPDLDIGSYPFYRRGEFGTSLVLRGRDADRLAAGTAEVVALVQGLGGTPIEE